MNVLSLGKQKNIMKPNIIPSPESYDHNREEYETDHDGIPLTWKENLTVAVICVLGASVVIGVIYLIAR